MVPVCTIGLDPQPYLLLIFSDALFKPDLPLGAKTHNVAISNMCEQDPARVWAVGWATPQRRHGATLGNKGGRVASTEDTWAQTDFSIGELTSEIEKHTNEDTGQQDRLSSISTQGFWDLEQLGSIRSSRA